MFNTSTCHLLPPLRLPCFSHCEMIPLDIPLVLPVDWPTTFAQGIHLPQNQANIIEVNSHASTHFVLVSHWHWNSMLTPGQSANLLPTFDDKPKFPFKSLLSNKVFQWQQVCHSVHTTNVLVSFHLPYTPAIPHCLVEDNIYSYFLAKNLDCPQKQMLLRKVHTLSQFAWPLVTN